MPGTGAIFDLFLRYEKIRVQESGDPEVEMSAAEEQCLQDQQPSEKETGKYFTGNIL